MDFGLSFHWFSSPLIVHAYFDAYWGRCPDTQRSTTGFCVFLSSNLISWSAKKKQSISHSSAEAEYRSLAHACLDIIWVSYLLNELQFASSLPITLLCDNLSTTYRTSNPIFHARTKHIELDYHYIR